MGDVDEEVMEATYRALCEHGYAGLTMQRIADEAGLSKAALHYHYDTKAGLLQTFLEHVADRFEAELSADSADPERRLRSIVATIFDPPGEQRGAFATALLEIKAQAPYDDAFRSRLRTLDRRLRRTIADAVRDGVEAGTFEAVDPDEVARFVAVAMNGAHARDVALGEDPVETRTIVEAYLEAELGIAFDGGPD